MSNALPSMRDRFGEIQEESLRLSRDAAPVVSPTLDVLCQLESSDVESILRGVCESDDLVTRVSSQTALEKGVVRDVLDRVVRQDLQCRETVREEFAAAYRDAGSPYKKMQGFEAGFGHRNVLFVLHSLPLSVWDADSFEIKELLIESDDPDDEDEICDVIGGYLVEKGKVFTTSVEMLRSACENDWPHWQELWRLM